MNNLLLFDRFFDGGVHLWSNEWILIWLLFPEDDHDFDFCMQNDIVFDNRFVKINMHVFAYDYLPLSTILFLDHFFQCLFNK